ncbi:MAG: hypothetical protein AAFX98_06795 [Pseudomonadota bacterium]
MLHVYGYAGCTTVKKARDWATNMGVEHDYAHFNKVDDLAAQLDEWVAAAGIDAVFNEKIQIFYMTQAVHIKARSVYF